MPGRKASRGGKTRKRLITAEDLYRLRSITGSCISPDGKRAVYAVQRVDRKSEKKYSNLWIADAAGGRPLKFTCGDHVDSRPRWSPDGKSIAFISNRRDDRQPQLYIIPVDGGEARRLTDLKGDFGCFEWSPDSRAIVCEFRRKDSEVLEMEADEEKKKLGIVARHIDRVFFKLDGSGMLPRERWHIWTVNVRTGKAAQLTRGDRHDEIGPSWSPDSRRIVFLSNRNPDPDLKPDYIDIFIMPARGGAPRRVPTAPGIKWAGGFSPDGRWLAYYGITGQGRHYKNMSLWVVRARRRGEGPARGARNLTARFDVDVLGETIGDVRPEPPVGPPVWSPDGSRLFFTVGRRGSTTLNSVAVAGRGAALETHVDGPGSVFQFSLDRSGTRVAYLQGDRGNPVDLYIKTIGGGGPRRLTRINAGVLGRIDLGGTEEVWFKGKDGNDLHGYILKPPGFDRRKKYPAVLEIHGGPMIQYGEVFMHEFYYLAAAGYIIFYSNPRGSQGYGEEHSKAIWGSWGKADYSDIMTWTDFVARKPYVDSRRMGVTGGSYGGFMTNWIIGHTRRFRAAVTQRSIVNMISKYGAGDYNWLLCYRFGGKDPWDAMEAYWEQSPLKYFGRVKTPTLVIHSEEDHRCPVVEGEQTFVALKKLGVDTEMVRFPDEPHGLSRTGRTDRRIERLRQMLRWFDKYLK
jgi:dipeptidyl aminopeptidase/acylaminoacyl peptidase